MDTPSVITPQELAKLIAKFPAKRIGRAAKPLRAQELSPVINKVPTTRLEGERRLRRLQRVGYIVPVDEQLEFGAEDYGYNDEGSNTSAWEMFETISNGV
jgi:hypothetical protein